MPGIAHAETARTSESRDTPRQKLLAALPVTERQIDCAGISTAVLEGGDGDPPVILLHGPSGYAAHWLRVAPALTKTHRVVAPDLPGHGNSSPPPLPLGTDRMQAWLRELIEQTTSSPPLLVGQTLGGAIAARFAASHGERIRGLVLVDTLGLSAFEPQPAFAQALGAFFEEPTRDTCEALWRQCAFDLDAVRRRMGPYWQPFETYNLELARTAKVSASVHALMQTFGGAIPERQLGAIRVPTALVWGRHDRATSLSVAQAASERHGWPLTIIEDCADDPPIEQPDALLRALRTFVGELP
jgi:pimeloyl-ACP methyl ester carboxylesterase